VNKSKNQSGSIHLVIIAALSVAVIGLLGFVFWQNYSNSNKTQDNKVSVETEKEAIISAYKRDVPGMSSYNNNIFSGLTIKDSKTPNYTIASIYVQPDPYLGGSNALLYKKAGGQWKYALNNTQGLMYSNCNEFNNDELRTAFIGEKCYDIDNNKMSTVESN